MKVKSQFACGCTITEDYDARRASDRSVVAEAKRNEGCVNWSGDCMECKQKHVADKIASLDAEELRAIVSEMSSYTQVRSLLKIERNKMVKAEAKPEAKPEAVTVKKEIGHVKFTYCFETAQKMKSGDKHIGHVQDLRHGYHVGSLFESVFSEFYVVTADHLKTIHGKDLSALEHNLRGNH